MQADRNRDRDCSDPAGDLEATRDPRAAAAPLPGGLTWLVDGYNVLHACLLSGTDRSRWWQAESRERVLSLAEQLGEPEAEIWVVFDGTGESQETYAPRPELESDRESGRGGRADVTPAVHIVFAPSADDWITRRVRGAEKPDRIAVVTSDRQLAGRTAHRGARVVRPRAFLELCGEAGRISSR